MAQVDFSNAVLNVNMNNGKRPLTRNYDMWLSYRAEWENEEAYYVTDNASKVVILDTPTKKSLLFTGTFNRAGHYLYSHNWEWEISNISYSAGDTYSFVIDIEVATA